MSADSQEKSFTTQFLNLDDAVSYSPGSSSVMESPYEYSNCHKYSENYTYAKSFSFEDTILCKDVYTPIGSPNDQESLSVPPSPVPFSSIFTTTHPSSFTALPERDTISSPLRKIVVPPAVINSSSESSLGFSEEYTELTQYNIFKFKNDFICGVLDANGNQCFGELSCHLHSLYKRRNIKRNLPLEGLLSKEVKHTRFFKRQRMFIINYYNKRTSMLDTDSNENNYPKQELISRKRKSYSSTVQDKIVLGTEIPFSKQGNNLQAVKRRRKHDEISSAVLRIGTAACSDTSKSTTSTSSGSTSSISTATHLQPRPITSNEKSDSEIDTTRSQTSSTLSTNSNDKASDNTKPDTRLSNSSKNRNQRSQTLNKRLLYLKDLSKAAETRIKETVSYLHYQLRPYETKSLEDRVNETESRFCT